MDLIILFVLLLIVFRFYIGDTLTLFSIALKKTFRMIFLVMGILIALILLLSF